jgi:hypothetical protein
MRLNNWSIAASYDTARIFAGLGFGSATASRSIISRPRRTRSSASEQPNPSYAWPQAVILSSVLVMRSSAFITVALAAKL